MQDLCGSAADVHALNANTWMTEKFRSGEQRGSAWLSILSLAPESLVHCQPQLAPSTPCPAE